MPRFAVASGETLDNAISIDHTDTVRPPRRATIRVRAWPQKNRDAAELVLTTVEGTQDALQAGLDEAGYEGYRLRQINGESLEPHALYSLVDALLPRDAPRKAKSPSGGGTGQATPQVPPRQRRPRERIMLTVNPSFDLLAKVIAPEFTMAQGVKEIIDNAIQSLIFFLIDRPNLSDEGWTPQIVIIIDLDCDLHRGRLRIVDNGGGLNPQQMKEWAECGNSTNRSRVTKMLEVDAKDPRVVGLCSNLISSYGIGGKGGGAALTREGKDINGNITLFSCRGADEDGHMNLQKINFNLKEAQRRQVDKDESPWNREYTPNLDLSDEPELKGYMQRPGWGDRITCLEVDNLSRAVLEQLRGLGSRTELVNEIAETWAFSFDPARYDEIARECDTFNRESNPKPMHIKASVEVCSGGSTPPQTIDINALAQAKHHKLISQPSAPEQPSSSSHQPRRGGLRGGGMLDAEDFYYEFDVTDGAGKQGHAVLHLTYFPIKEGVETLPKGCKPGFDVRWQSRLLKDERLRHLSFMNSSKLSRSGRGGPQKELCLLLDRVGHRVSGELLLDGNYAVNKMKSELLHAGEESPSGSVKLVEALTKPAPAEWEYVGSQQQLIERYTQWLQKQEKHDDNYRFVFEDVENASPPLSGYVTKVVQVGAKEFKAPRSEHGHTTESAALHLWLRKDVSKVYHPKTNVIWAEVFGFRFDAPAGLDHRGVEDACKAATDGWVLFQAAGATELQELPLSHIELKENSAAGIPSKQWKAHVKALQQALARSKPKEVVCIDAAGAAATSYPIVSEDTNLTLEDSSKGNVSEGTPLRLAVQVRNHDGKTMGVHELEKSFAIRLTTRHQPSGRELDAVKTIRFHSGGEAWLRPPILDEPGKWSCSMAVVGKDDDTPVGTPWSVTLTVAKAARYDSFIVGMDGDGEEKARLGEALPPLVVTALDAVESPFTLPELPLPQVTVEIVWQPQGQQLQIDEAGLQIVMNDGKVRLERLVLRGTLNGKSSGSIKFGVTLGDLPQYKTDKLDVKCGRPATLELESPDELQSAGPFDADASLPALRLHCKDQDGNPCGGSLITLDMEHDGDAKSAEPFEHTGRGPKGNADTPFETNAKGEVVIGGGKHRAFTVNGDALQSDREVEATLRFWCVAGIDHEADNDEDEGVPVQQVLAEKDIKVKLAQLEEPEQAELAKLNLFVQRQHNHPHVRCGVDFVVELQGVDSEGNACRIDLTNFGPETRLLLSGAAADAAADWGVWRQSDDGDGLEMTLQIGGTAGELSLELPPDYEHEDLCEPLTLTLVAGEPTTVVATLRDGAVINGGELALNVRLVDEHENFVEGSGDQGIEWNALQAEDEEQLLVREPKRRVLKGVAAELKAVVLTRQPLHAPTELALVVSAQFKKAGVIYRLKTENPCRVTIHPGIALINGLVVSRIELSGEGGQGVVDMDEEIPKVTQPTQPVTEALQLIAEPGGFVPELAMRVAFEDGSYLEPPTACQLRARLLDASDAVLVDESGAEAEVRRVGGQVELCTPGEEGRRAFLLRRDLRAPTKPGEYSLELSLTFGNTKGLPSKDMLKDAGRAEVTKVVKLVVVAGPAFQLRPTLLLPTSSPAIKVASNQEVELRAFARLVDACGNVIKPDANEAVKLSLRAYAMGSQDAPQMTLTLAQPTPTLHLVNGMLAAPMLQLAGEGPSGRYELCFELVADSKVSGILLVDYQNPADEGRREEETRRQEERLQELQGRLVVANKEVEELGKRKRAYADAARKSKRLHDHAVEAQGEIQQQIQQKRSSRDALGLDEEGVKRLKVAHRIALGPVESDPATSQQKPPSSLGPKVRASLKQLETSLTVLVNLSDGEGSERKRKRDFPIDLPSEENHHVQRELRPLPSGNDGGSQGLYVFKVSSRGGNEVSAEQLGDQCLRDDPQGEYLLDALQPNGRLFESLFESGRVADERLSDIAVALAAPWSGADFVTLRPPAAAAAAAPTRASLLAELAQLVRGTTIQLLQPASAAESAALLQKMDAATGLMKLAPHGSIHPPPAAHGASYLLNRLCCDDAEARVTWYRALGPYAHAIVFDQASAMCDYIAHAETSSVLIALEDDVDLLSGGDRRRYAMFSHDKHSELAMPASSTCRLAQTKEADEVQVLSGTAEGSKVVEFEQAARELSGLEEREQVAADEVAAAESEKKKAEEAQQQIEQKLSPLQQEIERLRQQTGTPAGSRGQKRAR